MTKPLYFYNGTTFELVGPTTPQSPIAYQTSAPTAPATGDLWIDSDGDVDTYNRQLTRYYFVATASQTTITGIDANGLTLAYVAGSEAVYVNGALQVRGQDYTATNGTSVVMTSALAVNDVVEIFAYTAFTVANAYTKTETDGIAAAAPGMKLIVPTSVAVGSGTASIATSGTVTFSGCSSVSLNGVFSSTYDVYKILIPAVGDGNSLQFRMRASGTNETGSIYSYSNAFITSDSGTQAADKAELGSLIDFREFGNGSVSIEIFKPFLSLYTSMNWVNAVGRTGGAGRNRTRQGTAIVGNTTSYDGFSIFLDAGTALTGTIQVYGYKD